MPSTRSSTESLHALDRQDALRRAFVKHSFSDLRDEAPGLSDGCVILGRGGKSGNTYVTRYRIDHEEQLKEASSKAVMFEECVPCCGKSARRSVKSFLWNVVKSEAFLFTLEIIALSLGVVKEAMDIRSMNPDWELAQSVAETFAAITVIVVRIFVGIQQYKEFKETAYNFEHVTPEMKDLRGRGVRRWRNTYIIIGVMLVLSAIGMFVAFYFLVHLGWTILSNNFVLLLFTVLAGLYSSRVDEATLLIRQDQQKTVLFEACLLLQESYMAQDVGISEQYKKDITKFVKAVQDTSFLEQPGHIGIGDQFEVKKWDLFNLQLLSLV